MPDYDYWICFTPDDNVLVALYFIDQFFFNCLYLHATTFYDINGLSITLTGIGIYFHKNKNKKPKSESKSLCKLFEVIGSAYIKVFDFLKKIVS
jgi:hypothetical protein